MEDISLVECNKQEATHVRGECILHKFRQNIFIKMIITYKITFCLHSKFSEGNYLLQYLFCSVSVLVLAVLLELKREKKCRHGIPQAYCVPCREFCLPQTMF